MITKDANRRARRAARLVSWGLLAVLCLALTFAQMTHTPMLVEERVALPRYLDGTAHRPFIYRALVPQTILVLDTAIPEAAVRPTADRVARVFLPRSLAQTPDPTSYLYLAAILVLSLLGYALIAARLYRRCFPETRHPEILAPAFLLLLFPFVAGNVGHIYDFTVLFFMMALLWAMSAGRHALFLLIFAVSCLNKETSVFASVAYLCYYIDRMPWRKLALMMLLQGAIFLSIYPALRHQYAGNPGGGMENWLWEQFEWIGRRPFSDYFSLLGGILLVTYHWPEKPLVLRRSAFMLVPHLLLFATSAHPGEVRNLYESVPLIGLFVIRNISILIVPSGSADVPLASPPEKR